MHPPLWPSARPTRAGPGPGREQPARRATFALRPGTARSCGSRFFFPPSCGPKDVRTRTPGRLRDRNGFTLDSATGALGFPTRDRDRADTDVGAALRSFLHRAAPSFATGPLPASNHRHRGAHESPPDAPPGHLRDRNGVATGSVTSGLGIATVWVSSLWNLCHDSLTAPIPRLRGDGSVSSPDSSGNTFVIATVSPRLRHQCHPVSQSGSRPYRLRCCGSSATIH